MEAGNENNYDFLRRLFTGGFSLTGDNPLSNDEIDSLKDDLIMFAEINSNEMDRREARRDVYPHVSKHLKRKFRDAVTEERLDFVDSITVSQMETFLGVKDRHIVGEHIISNLFLPIFIKNFNDFDAEACKEQLNALYHSLIFYFHNFNYELLRCCFALYVLQFGFEH